MRLPQKDGVIDIEQVKRWLICFSMRASIISIPLLLMRAARMR